MTQNNWLQDLTKSDNDKWIGGVCGGLGEHSPIPSWAWRLLFAILVICYGTGLLIYILLWIFVPTKSKTGN
ncbi:MAG: PspC domain-containing protein [Deltaproteobacteria bacterium]|nr:PspC domain-containing protein [Deltaproteobacteria bacterium]